jgi:putative ABC transport system permease protein
MLRTTLSGLRYHALRLVSSSLAIAAGVAFVAGTLAVSASMNRAFYSSFAAGAKNVSAAVGPPAGAGRDQGRPGRSGGPTVPASALSQVAHVPGVAAAAGRVAGPAPLIGSNGTIIGGGGRPGLGINVAADPALRGFTLASGRLPTAPGEAAADTSTAADEHFRLGQSIRVVSQAGAVRRYRLVGTIDLGVNHSYGNSTVLAFQTATAFQVTGRPGYDQVVARALPGVSQAALVARIKAVPGLSADLVQTGGQLANAEASAAVHFTDQFTSAILIFAVIALVVAALVIYNTFTILTAQREREIALLRCVGASRRQVFTGVLAESLAAGAVASAAGIATGLGLGWGLERLLTAFGAPVPPGPLTLNLQTVTISMALGLTVTLLSALPSARSATTVAPVAALGGLGGHAGPRVGREARRATLTRKIGWWRAGTAVVSAAAGLALTFLGTQHVNGSGGFLEIAAGGCVFFVAVLATGPLITPPVMAFLGWLPGLLLGVPARLATANARRNPHRVAATTAALTIGVTLMTVFTVVASSAEASAAATIQEHYPFDYTVQAGRAGGQAVPPRIISALRSSSRIGVMAPYYQRRSPVNAVAAGVGALAPSGLAVISPPVVSGSLADLRSGTAAVDSGELRALGTRQGGVLAVRTPDAGLLRLRVVAVYNGANGPLPSVLLAQPDYVRGFRPRGAQAVYVNAARGVSPGASRNAVAQATASDPLLQVSSLADYKSALSSRINQVLSLFGVLLGLAILIALIGIANTLTLSVLERTRESALLRALGLTRGQLRGMLLVEALLMALLGVILGVCLGAGFGMAMVNAFIKSAGGGVVSIPYSRIGLYLVLGACAGLLAAVQPARRAARTSVVTAMAEA